MPGVSWLGNHDRIVTTAHGMAIDSDRQQKNLIRDRFTSTAEVFGDYAVAHRVREAELLASMVQASPGDRAIDLACGPGTLALRFAPHVRWICGLDLTPAMLVRADDSAGLHRRYVSRDSGPQGGEPELHLVNTMLFIAGEKI